MVALGIAVALALQFLVISGDHLVVGPWLSVSPVAIVVGIVDAKMWFIVLHRREHRINGWCIQGFITGAILAAAILLAVIVHAVTTRYVPVTAGGSAYVVDRWTGKTEMQ